MIANRVSLMGLDYHLFAKGTLNMGKGHRTAKKSHVQAVVVLTGLTKPALTAGTRGRDGDALAWAQMVDLCTDGVDKARDLMAQGHGPAYAHSAEATMLVVMKIRAADSAKGDAHAHLPWAGIGHGGLFDSQVSGGVANNRFHGALLGRSGDILKRGGDAAIDIEDVTIDKT
jgi:hypothetical protein